MDFQGLLAEAQEHSGLEKPSNNVGEYQKVPFFDSIIPLIEFGFIGKLPMWNDESMDVLELPHQQDDLSFTFTGDLTEITESTLLVFGDVNRSGVDYTCQASADISNGSLTSAEFTTVLEKSVPKRYEDFEVYLEKFFTCQKIVPVHEEGQSVANSDVQEKRLIETDHAQGEAQSSLESITNNENLASPNLFHNDINENTSKLSIDLAQDRKVISEESWTEPLLPGVSLSNSNTKPDSPALEQTSNSNENIPVDGNASDSKLNDEPSAGKEPDLSSRYEKLAEEIEDCLGISQQDISALVTFLNERQDLEYAQRTFFQFNPKNLSFSKIKVPQAKNQAQAEQICERHAHISNAQWALEGYPSFEAWNLVQRTERLLRRNQIMTIDKIFFRECHETYSDQDLLNCQYLRCPRCMKNFKRQDGTRRHFRRAHIERLKE